MDNTIFVVLISAGTSALINGLSSLILKILDLRNKKLERKESNIRKLNEEKKDAYLKAMNNLLFIKKGLSITKEKMLSSNYIDTFNQEKEDLKYATSNFRLYASDILFDFYFTLLKAFEPYSYKSEDNWRLSENAKTNFDTGIFIISRLMQEDLCYREYNKGIKTIKCPKCGEIHDFIHTCKCGLTFCQLQEELVNITTENSGQNKEH